MSNTTRHCLGDDALASSIRGLDRESLEAVAGNVISLTRHIATRPGQHFDVQVAKKALASTVADAKPLDLSTLELIEESKGDSQ